jgi:hypothetical protein
MIGRRIPLPEQLRRTAELDRIRCQRPLTAAERAEADNLAARAEMRAWRAVQTAREKAFARASR